jgi:hypothetical protein
MKSGFQSRIYEMEVTPPDDVWDKISASLPEINSDNRIASKIYDYKVSTPENFWPGIESMLSAREPGITQKKTTLFYLKRIAVAATFAGIIFSLWYWTNRTKSPQSELASTPTITATDKKNESELNPEKKNQLPEDGHTTNIQKKEKQATGTPGKRRVTQIEAVKAQLLFSKPNPADFPELIKTEKSFAHNIVEPGTKIFNQPIDNLSKITAGEQYLMIVNSNGRLVNVDTAFGHLVPQLQNKPLNTEDYESLFGEGAIWRDKLNEWRRQLAMAPVSSGDIFSAMIELLKSVQEK